MLNQELLIYVLFFTNIVVKGIDIYEMARKRNELRQKISDSIVDVTELEHFTDIYSNTSFDLCSPHIDRSLLCEAVNIRLEGEFPIVEDKPCSDLLSRDAYFDCSTVDGIILKLQTLHLENKFLVKGHKRIYKVFAVPDDIFELLGNPIYKDYVHMRNWIHELNPSPETIGKELENFKLSTVYTTALQLEILQVQKEILNDTKKQGIAICEETFNRGLLCRAINIHMYGQTYNVNDEPCEDQASGPPRYSCLMANGETLFMERGKYKTHVYLRNYKNKLLFAVETLPIHGPLFNEYALEGIVEERLEDQEFVTKLLRTPDYEKFLAEAFYPEPEAILQMPSVRALSPQIASNTEGKENADLSETKLNDRNAES